LLERFALRILIYTLGLWRWVAAHDARLYALLTLGGFQPLHERIARLRAREVFLKAHAECPAYARFLQEQGFRGSRRWTDVPVTTKQNYVKRYAIEERCYGGRLKGRGEMIDESSGSSGMPNNWVRSAAEREDVKRLLQLNYDLMYGARPRILLNCFALGPWATGMNVSMSLVDVGVLKSLGPDAQKLENTLSTFGPTYRYLVFGYPPFVKSFVDGTTLDLTAYDMDLVVGGEGISERLRQYLRRYFRTVVSSYGASDLEINIGIETDWTIALRARCAADPALSRMLFGRDNAPMLFQFNPLDYVIETLPSGEMAFTVCRVNGAAPKIRYNLKDEGGVIPFRELSRRLATHGIDPASLATRIGRFPILFVYGRSDLTVAFYGAKLYPADFESTLLSNPDLAARVRAFQMSCHEDDDANRRLRIALELAPGVSTLPVDCGRLQALFYDGLAASNQDFREVRRMFGASAIEVATHACGTGPFEGSDIRVKLKYVAEAERPAEDSKT
jgi:phenylacetate-CoA ligase